MNEYDFMALRALVRVADEDYGQRTVDHAIRVVDALEAETESGQQTAWLTHGQLQERTGLGPWQVRQAVRLVHIAANSAESAIWYVSGHRGVAVTSDESESRAYKAREREWLLTRTGSVLLVLYSQRDAALEEGDQDTAQRAQNRIDELLAIRNRLFD